jgi:C4-dicarboxylate transporter DctM subunit
MTIVLFLTFIIALLINIPVAFALGISGIAAIYFMSDLSLMTLTQLIVPMFVDASVLICVPLFIFAGNIMASGGLGDRIIRLSKIFVGRSRGGLSSVNIIASMFFGGISGSAAADTSAIGSVLIPVMERAGYPKGFATAVTVVSSPLGMIIPPSILIIVYCWVIEESVASMFAAGYLPGLLVGLTFMLMGWIISVANKYPRSSRYTFKEAVKVTFENIPAIIMPIAIVGGIIAGIFTPTEAAGIAVLYGFVVSKFYYKELKWSDLPRILDESAKLTGIVLLILGLATAFAWLIAFDRAPFKIADALGQLGMGKNLFLICYIILLFILGTFLAPTEAVIIVVPILYPVAIAAGIHSLHFGIITVTALAIGQVTPPVGFCLYVGAAVSGCKIETIVKHLIPFYFTSIAVVLLIAFFPDIALYLPRLLGFI